MLFSGVNTTALILNTLVRAISGRDIESGFHSLCLEDDKEMILGHN